MNKDEFEIYVRSELDHEVGRTHGVWINLHGKDEEEVLAEIEAMLAASPCNSRWGVAEDWAITDWDLGDLNVDLEVKDLSEILEFYDALPDKGTDLKACIAYVNFEDDLGFVDNWEDHYQGEWDSKEEFAESHVEEAGLPDWVSNYFDYGRFAEDLFEDHYIYVDGFVFDR